ncbi:hypothetical protein TNCV_5027301 [Trichonephila clavipes]|nr:hypothetical protein TNCV_5027301 [Trichonephila clavipes]
MDLSVSSRKKKTQLFTSAENSTADPENIFLPPKENERAFQKAYKTFNLPNNDSSLGIKEFLLLRKEETIFIFRNELETYKALKKMILKHVAIYFAWKSRLVESRSDKLKQVKS